MITTVNNYGFRPDEKISLVDLLKFDKYEYNLYLKSFNLI